MNRKALVIFLIGLVLSALIFFIVGNNNIDYVALGDNLSLGVTPFNKYNKSFTDYFSEYLDNKNNLKSFDTSFVNKDYYVTDYISDMKDAKERDTKRANINQIISSADIITISIGQKNINSLLKVNYKNNKLINLNKIYKFVDEEFEDYKTLLSNIRKINDCKIFIIGFYNPLTNTNQKDIKELNKLFDYINEKYKMLEELNKNIYYVSISEDFNNKSYYLPNSKHTYPSLEGYNFIANKIICKYEEKC